MTTELRRCDLQLLVVWIRAGVRTLVRTPRAAFFTFVTYSTDSPAGTVLSSHPNEQLSQSLESHV